MVGVFKIINDFGLTITEDLFLFRENTHNIRNFQLIFNESKKAVRYVLETMKYRTQLLLHWAHFPEKCKFAASLNSFKQKNKIWKCKICLCRLCQTY